MSSRLVIALLMPAGLATITATIGACGDDAIERRDASTAATDSAVATDTMTVVPTDTTSAPTDSTAGEDTSVAEDTSVVDTADTAAPPAEVRFLVLGDTGTGSPTQAKVAGVMLDTCNELGCDFAVLLGDNIYDAGVESVLDAQWQTKFEVPYKDIDMPFYAVLGNHDNGGFLSQLFGDTFGGAGAEFERGDHEVAYSAISEKWRMPARSYDFVHGPAHFFALDTNDMVWSLISDEAETRNEAQVAMFPTLMDESTATWKIAFGHHPYRSNGRHGNAGTYEGIEEGLGDLIAAVPFVGDLGPTVTGKGVKDGLEDVVCGRADIYFAGHDHNRQWFPEETTGVCAGTTFVVSGGGSKLTEFKGSQPSLFQDDQKTGFFWVHLKGNQISVVAVSEDGEKQWTHQDAK